MRTRHDIVAWPDAICILICSLSERRCIESQGTSEACALRLMVLIKYFEAPEPMVKSDFEKKVRVTSYVNFDLKNVFSDFLGPRRSQGLRVCRFGKPLSRPLQRYPICPGSSTNLCLI